MEGQCVLGKQKSGKNKISFFPLFVSFFFPGYSPAGREKSFK
jgi:hypothetical protein